MGQHDAASAPSDAPPLPNEASQHELRRGSGGTWHRVVLRHPKSVLTELISALG
ncbi:hypothetical protein [Yaniella halotolerans]|uniref:hypothetical protein n=1 Tax=Yaniella halotolerans TaxID=225453 RepID=UPI001FDF7B84|nr:hypothetical protein [Yaniella halotolerans]